MSNKQFFGEVSAFLILCAIIIWMFFKGFDVLTAESQQEYNDCMISLNDDEYCSKTYKVIKF